MTFSRGVASLNPWLQPVIAMRWIRGYVFLLIDETKVGSALLLTDETEQENELDVVTLVLHTTSLRGNRWEISVPKSFLQKGAFHCQLRIG